MCIYVNESIIIEPGSSLFGLLDCFSCSLNYFHSHTGSKQTNCGARNSHDGLEYYSPSSQVRWITRTCPEINVYFIQGDRQEDWSFTLDPFSVDYSPLVLSIDGPLWCSMNFQLIQSARRLISRLAPRVIIIFAATIAAAILISANVSPLKFNWILCVLSSATVLILLFRQKSLSSVSIHLKSSNKFSQQSPSIFDRQPVRYIDNHKRLFCNIYSWLT